jgi:hypothetical protein
MLPTEKASSRGKGNRPLGAALVEVTDVSSKHQ